VAISLLHVQGLLLLLPVGLGLALVMLLVELLWTRFAWNTWDVWKASTDD
jgi:hypothetical protein